MLRPESSEKNKRETVCFYAIFDKNDRIIALFVKNETILLGEV